MAVDFEVDLDEDEDEDFEQPFASELAPSTNSPPIDLSQPRKPPAAAPEFEPREFGSYRLLKKCGEGAMGQVFMAKNHDLDRIVALKLIHPRQLGDRAEDAIKRFRREAKALARTSHENVIRVFRCAREGGTWFLEMEYFEGVDLHQWVVSRPKPAPLGPACHCLIQAADGLAHAHSKQIYHRDVKPSNLLTNAQLVVKVTDFGLAKVADESYTILTHNNNGALGTPDYMSPEQFQDARTVDARSDIYSLGCVLHFLAVGRHPFADKPNYANKMFAHLNESPPSLRAARPEVPRSLENVYQKMMAKAPEKRFQSMAEVADALRPLLVRKRKSPANLTNSVGVTLLPLPAGEFLMGSPDHDEMAYPDEKPRREVRVEGFLLAAHPVTQKQYQAVMGRNPSYFSPNGFGKDKIQGPTDEHPVENVSWFDAIAFCNKLSVRENLPPYYRVDGETVTIAGGAGYRLPFEREWEYACRAGTATRYFFGDPPDKLEEYAWYGEDWRTGATHPAGQKAANPWGLHDMLGNVWEWCWDWYDGECYSYDHLLIGGPNGGDARVLRGGSCGNDDRGARPAFRFRFLPAGRCRGNGFRVARASP